nr:PREDICTED: gastric intrinsic factor-like [Latimeria chalumnae]|eukprot:XP_006013605.2 PREDICTED: gastric intrinsic factor-like [Latimeria chalumnae]
MVAVPFTLGEVALYTMAFTASCQNLSNISALGTQVNLLRILYRKMIEEVESIENRHGPPPNYFHIDLALLSLSHHNLLSPAIKLIALAHNAQDIEIPDVDTAAVAVLALQSIHNSITPPSYGLLRWTIQWLIRKMVNYILETQQTDGTFGNIYSTGLVIQALSVAPKYFNPSSWNCSQSLQKLLNEIPKGSFNNPMAASQAVPSLEGRTYLDVNKLDCAADTDNLPKSDLPKTTPSTTASGDITVEYTVTDALTQTFTESIAVTVPAGSVLLKVLEEAQKMNPIYFSFKTKSTLWGPYVTQIGSLSENTNNKSYWQFLSGTVPIPTGVGEYRPANGEHIVAKFTTY